MLQRSNLERRDRLRKQGQNITDQVWNKTQMQAANRPINGPQMYLRYQVRLRSDQVTDKDQGFFLSCIIDTFTYLT